MYITLNSATESNDANFVNSWSDTMMIKANSYICLIGAGFQTHTTGFDLGRVEAFEFRNGYGFTGFTARKNVIAGNYTVQQLADEMNRLSGLDSPIFRVHYQPVEDPTQGLIFQVNYGRHQEWTNTHYFQLSNRLAVNERVCSLVGQDTTVVPNLEPVILKGVSNNIDQISCVDGLTANAFDYLVSPTMPFTMPWTKRDGTTTTYVEPTNLPDRLGFDMNQNILSSRQTWGYLDGGHYGSSYITNQVHYVENDGDINPIVDANLQANYYAKVEVKNTGNAEAFLRKTDGTTLSLGDRTYNPGDVFSWRLSPYTRNDGTQDIVIEHMKNTWRNIAWVTFDFNDGGGLPVFQTPYTYKCLDQLSLNQGYYPIDGNLYKTYIGHNAVGPRLSQQYKQNEINDFGINLNVSMESINLVTIQDYKSNGLTPSTTPMPNGNGTRVQRFVAGPTRENMCVQFGNGTQAQGLQSAFPTLITGCFQFTDDTGLGGLANMTLWGGRDTTSAAKEIGTIVIGGTSISINDFAGNSVTINPLLNGTGAALTWEYNKNYCISIGNAGTNNQVISCQITRGEDMAFFAGNATSVSANGRLPDLMFMCAKEGPNDNPLNIAARMSGYIWDFRFCQQNNGEVIPTNYLGWNQIHNQIAAMSVDPAAPVLAKTPAWFLNYDDRVDWNNPAHHPGLDIRSVPQSTSNSRTTMIYDKTDNVAPTQQNWHQLGNLSFEPNFTTHADVWSANVIGGVNGMPSLETSDMAIVTDGLLATTNVLVQDVVPSLELLRVTIGNDAALLRVKWGDYVTELPNYFITVGGGDIAGGVDVREQIYNICIENLPHRTFNGRTRNLCKSIHEVLHNETNNTFRGNNELINVVPKQKIWIPLNNGGDLPINEIHCRITDGALIEAVDLIGNTHIHLEIKQKDEIFS
mgnify:CR=1 FL=1